MKWNSLWMQYIHLPQISILNPPPKKKQNSAALTHNISTAVKMN